MADDSADRPAIAASFSAGRFAPAPAPGIRSGSLAMLAAMRRAYSGGGVFGGK
jgi:hypothetical protein